MRGDDLTLVIADQDRAIVNRNREIAAVARETRNTRKEEAKAETGAKGLDLASPVYPHRPLNYLFLRKPGPPSA